MRRRDVIAALTAGAFTPAAKASLRPWWAHQVRGLYADGKDYAAVGRFDEFGAGFYLFDYAKSRAGRLSKEPKSAMLSSFDESGTPVASVTIGTNGLTIDKRRFAPVHTERKPFVARNGNVSLSAELAYRLDGHPRGTILLIYGSGPAPKKALDLWSFHFLAQGWAVITYDKRGSGYSQGDWRRASLETLTADVRAVIAACPNAPRPLGAWGASQAGWIMPQLAAQRAIDFIVMHAGAATTPGQQILDNVEAELLAYGFPPDEIAKALAYYELDTDVSRGRAPWSAIDAAYRQATAAKAEWLLAPPAAADAPERTFIRLVADFDPAPYWRKTSVPVLALFGSKDVIVPPARNRDALRALIPAQTPFHDQVLENANHLFMVAETGVRSEYPKRTSIHPAYFSTIDAWIKHYPSP